MFAGFTLETIDADDTAIRARHRLAAGKPPLLLLHGNPQTHCMWHLVAPRLAERFSVVAPDLTGYGDSEKPPTTPDHAPYSKRAMARDQIAVMKRLGFERFFVAGHDRGARVGYRMALDHPQRVARLAVLDIVPTWEAYMRADMAFGLSYFHWFFMTQPFDLPERLIGADPEFYWRRHTAREPKGPGFFAAPALEDYLRCFRNPATIHAICEDYRAAASIDMAHDEADRNAGRKITAPVLALWGAAGRLEAWYDVLAIWRDWALDVRGRALACGHYLPEERPGEVAAELEAFFGD
ncbi:MAG TPA: alpha/beta hydrolase [Burkholderiales bacterium]|nr:alpha/beta hydrolase [Burkholderiales bacterium]